MRRNGIFSRVLESLSKVESFGRAEQHIYRVRDLEAKKEVKRGAKEFCFHFISVLKLLMDERRKGESNLSRWLAKLVAHPTGKFGYYNDGGPLFEISRYRPKRI